jgi:pimeloyl-ACP methyl ester carboxylesterase
VPLCVAVHVMKTDVILLPGLHGSTTLFESFVALAPPWAKCLPIALPTEGDQAFDTLADLLEPKLRSFEGFVLFAESFAGPVAARLSQHLGSKVVLLVLCNPLVEAPVPIAPFFAAPLLQSRIIPAWLVSYLMTGGDQPLARTVLREVRSLPKDVLGKRLATACSVGREDLASRLTSPVLGVIGSEDRLISPGIFREVLSRVPFAVQATIRAPHLAAQIAPAAVWQVISGELERAA